MRMTRSNTCEMLSKMPAMIENAHAEDWGLTVLHNCEAQFLINRQTNKSIHPIGSLSVEKPE